MSTTPPDLVRPRPATVLRLAIPFLILQVAAVLILATTTLHLGPRIASHFGANGQGTAWMPQRRYLVTMLVMTTVLPWMPMAAAIVVALRAWLPAPLRVLPAARQVVVHRRIVQLLALVAVAHVLVMLGAHLLVVEANLHHQPMSRAAGLVPVAMLIVVGIGILRLHRSIMATR